MRQFAFMNSTIEILRNEAKKLRSVADRIDAFASELDEDVLAARRHTEPALKYYAVMQPNGATPALSPDLEAIHPREFKGMTQHAAILKALEMFGPQTTKQLFNLLNAGGMAFKKPVYISAILGRLKSVVERTPDNRIKLKAKTVEANTLVAK
jgi:hypothetical protein